MSKLYNENKIIKLDPLSSRLDDAGFKGGLAKRNALKLKMVNKGGKKVPFFAADGKGAKDLGRVESRKGGKIPPQLKKFVMAKKKKAKMKKKK